MISPTLLGFFVCLAFAPMAHAQGVMIPATRDVAPLEMLSHQVEVSVEDQVAVTKVTQVFHNPADRALEATYVFPVPKGASVRKFAMWVDGKEVNGEMVEADKARGIYTDIVRRTQDPGLLEYVGTNLLQLKVFPVPARGDQKVALSFTSVATEDAGLTEYVYPLAVSDASQKRTNSSCKFSIDVNLKSQHTLQNIYSPSHDITLKRVNDHEAKINFNSEAGAQRGSHDFQLFYTLSDKDVGLTMLPFRPDASSDGYFMLLVSPRAELDEVQKVHRDMVFVLDTSGSMAGAKMEQAKKALKFCLSNLDKGDRFCVMNFSTTVHQHADHLVDATSEHVEKAKKWVDKLESTGGTAIDEALGAALKLRSGDSSRTYTMVFFTDGQPTVGETNCDKILKNVMEKNSKSTRIFTFGVGDDVNACFLDKLAEETRACSSYVRPAEDIEVKVSNLYAKISHPVLTNLKLIAGKGAELSEIYPVHLPDLFHGSQLVVLGKYSSSGHVALTLSGEVGHDKREFVYEVKFPEKTDDARNFVEDLWARRKIGYLLEQIRNNGEKKELVEEVVSLAKKHGIATPYTSYLVVPDGTAPRAATAPSDYTLHSGGRTSSASGTLHDGVYFGNAHPITGGMPAPTAAPAPAREYESFDSPALPTSEAVKQFKNHGYSTAPAPALSGDIQTGQRGVDMALYLNELRNQNQVAAKANRAVNGRNCLDVGGVWIDERFNGEVKTLNVKAQSDAYFRILEKHPKMKEVFQLGNKVVWITPSGVALVIDPGEGKDKLTDDEIEVLFAVSTKF
jgi:Ca-activated chloride channel family protein